MTSDESVQAAAKRVRAEAGHLDVLVNNAGITGGRKPPGEITADDLRAVYETNVFGVVRVTQAFLPLLEASEAPVIVNVSSGLGSLAVTTDPDRFESTFISLPYPSSKSALNMLTSQYAKAYPAMRINAVDPGYTATDLNGHRGTQTVAEGAEIIVRMASIDPNGPTGAYLSASARCPGSRCQEPGLPPVPLNPAGRPLGQGDHADRLGLGHVQAPGDRVGGMALQFRQRAVGRADPQHLGQEPFPGVRGQLLGDLAEGVPGGLGRLGDVGQQAGVSEALLARPLDGGHRGLPGGRAARVTGVQHGRGGGPHPGRQRGLHLGGGRQPEHVGHVPRFAGQALHVLAHLVQRDDRDEEQGEEAPPGPVPVLPVATALAAVEHALPDGVIENPQPEDDQQLWLLPRSCRRHRSVPRTARTMLP